MRKLFLHIGAPKTGSTAIQHFLADQREALLRGRILYPAAARIGRAHHVIGAAVYPGRAGRLGGETRDAALARAMDELSAEIRAHEPETLILSTEYLWGVIPPHQVRRLLDAFGGWSVHVVAYLRRQDLLAQSLYVQSVKGGHSGGFTEWLERALAGRNAPFDFLRVLRSWSACGAAIIVRVYEKGSIEADVRADFLRTIGGVPAVAPPSEPRAVNATPDAATVELLRLVNREIADPDMANRIRRIIMRNSPSRALFSPLTYFGHEEAARFMDRFAEGNRMVARDFLGRADGVLFREPLPAPGAEPPRAPDEGELLRRLVALLPSLVDAGARAGRGASRRARQREGALADVAEPAA